jgi:hypothetical protein
LAKTKKREREAKEVKKLNCNVVRPTAFSLPASLVAQKLITEAGITKYVSTEEKYCHAPKISTGSFLETSVRKAKPTKRAKILEIKFKRPTYLGLILS